MGTLVSEKQRGGTSGCRDCQGQKRERRGIGCGAYPIPLGEPAPVMMQTLSLRRWARGEVSRWALTDSSLARVLLRNSS